MSDSEIGPSLDTQEVFRLWSYPSRYRIRHSKVHLRTLRRRKHQAILIV